MGVYSLEPIEEEEKGALAASESMKESVDPNSTEGESAATIEQIPHKEEQDKARSQAYEKVLEKVRTSSAVTAKSDDTTIQSDVDEIAQVEEASRIERLVGVARNKGAEHAFKVAWKLGDYYTLDKLHDTLIDNFYEELVQKGFVQKDQ